MSDTSSSSFIGPRYEENKLMSRFAVTATCGEAYEGVAQVSMCQEPGEPFRGGEHAGLGGGWTNLFLIFTSTMGKWSKFDSYFLKLQTGGVCFLLKCWWDFWGPPISKWNVNPSSGLAKHFPFILRSS